MFKTIGLIDMHQKIVDFWGKHWGIVFPAALAAIVALFIHFDSKDLNEKQNDTFSNQTLNNLNASNKPQIPPFFFPKNINGHIKASLSGFAESNCPNEFVTKNKQLLLQIALSKNIPLNEITPFIINLTQVTGQNSEQQVFSQQFETYYGANKFFVKPPSNKGEYYLDGGFYLKSELIKEFPSFYSVRCKIKVKG